MHIDKEGVFDPQALYQAAGLTHDQIHSAIEELWLTMKAIYLQVFGHELQTDDYTGEDICTLAALRDAALRRHA